MFSSLTFTPVVSSHAACTASLRRSRRAAVPTCALGPAAGSALATDGREVRVVVSHDGRLISQDLPSGSYTVSSWWNGAAHRKERALESAPNCDVNHGTDCALFCTLTAPGDLICEGLYEGVYTVHNAVPSEACSWEGGVAVCAGEGSGSAANWWTQTPKTHIGALGG